METAAPKKAYTQKLTEGFQKRGAQAENMFMNIVESRTFHVLAVAILVVGIIVCFIFAYTLSTEEVTIEELVNCPGPADPDNPDETDYSDQVCGVKYKLDGNVYNADMTKLLGRDTYQRDGETKYFVGANYFTRGQKAYVIQETKKLKKEPDEPNEILNYIGIGLCVILCIVLLVLVWFYKFIKPPTKESSGEATKELGGETDA